MKYQHSISATYVLTDKVKPEENPCMMLHPRDSEDSSFELTLYPNLETALHSLDEEANRFFKENRRNLIYIKQFYSPEYKLPIYKESRPEITEVRDIIRILIYQ